MTEADLRDLLRHLAGHLATLHEDLEEAGWHAARTSQTGVRTGTTGSKPPCSITDLDFLIDEVSPVIRGWCTELQRCARITGLPQGWVPLNVWVAFLSRNRSALLAQDWGQDAAAELSDLEYELRHRLYPNLKQRENLPTGELPPRLTEAEMCQAFNVQPSTIRSWKNRGKIRDTGATKRVLVKGEAEHHALYDRTDGAPWPTRKETA